MIRKKVRIVGLILASTVFSGCSVFQQGQSYNQAAINAANDYQKANDSQRINQYFTKLNPGLPKQNDAAKLAQPVQVTIAQAIDKYVPADFKIYVESDVNVKTLVTYNPSLSWIDALGKSLSDIGVEASANLYKKSMTLRAYKTSLAEVIDKYIPGSYKVFTDPDIDVDAPIRFDTSQHWIDALSKAGADAGIDVTANLAKKIIYLKPLTTTNKSK